MHEYSIVASLIDVCEKEAKKHHAKAIERIEIALGRLSGVEPHLLQSSFDTFKEETLCEEATLVIELCDVILECEVCHERSVLKKNHFICPKCQSESVRMVGGQELHVNSIVIKEA